MARPVLARWEVTPSRRRPTRPLALAAAGLLLVTAHAGCTGEIGVGAGTDAGTADGAFARGDAGGRPDAARPTPGPDAGTGVDRRGDDDARWPQLDAGGEIPPDASPPVDGPSSPDVQTPDAPAFDWDCARSEYQGVQYWTCFEGAIYRCDGAGRPERTVCPEGCRLGPLATNDVCTERAEVPSGLPRLEIVIRDGLFAEGAVRGPLEEGLAYAVERMYTLLAIPENRRLPDVLTLTYSASGNSYCSGQAFAESTSISCPYGYPITGSNQNYVVNISIHELGHILALHLIASASVRNLCANEGLASWIAGRYWMNHRSQPVSSLREAARGAIADGVTPSMTNCVSASDRHYKIYASFFEYLEQNVPGGILEVALGQRSPAAYEAAWLAWLR